MANVRPISTIGSPISEKPRSVDDVLNLIRPVGRYQRFIVAVFMYVTAAASVHALFMGYGGLKPKWICSDQIHSNSSELMEPTDSCEVYKKCSPGNLTFVSNFYSVVSEWALVCDKEYIVNLMTSIQMVGQLVGAVIIGPICDLYGRKWPFITVLSGLFLSGALSTLSPNAMVFVAFRFAIGIFSGADIVTAWIFTAETTTNRYRFLLRSIAIGGIMYWNQLLVAYVSKDWRWYTIIGTLEGIPVIFVVALFTYESPRWLVQKGRTEEATRILRKIAKINKTSDAMPATIELETESKVGRTKKYHFWHLFRTKRIALCTVVCMINFFAASIAYFGLYYNMGSISNDIYVSSAVLAAVNMAEIPVAILDMCSVKVNRKYLMLSFFSLGTLCSVLIALFVSAFASQSASTTLIVLSSTIGQTAIGAAFDLSYIYAIELFPTLLRSNATALMSISARIGGVIAPQLLNFSSTWMALPYVCFAAVGAVAIFTDLLFLPNTKKMHLPETYEQASQKMSNRNQDTCNA